MVAPGRHGRWQRRDRRFVLREDLLPDVDSEGVPVTSALTKREAAVLALFETEGELNEGMMADYLWPLVRRPRLVTNSLVRKGMVTLGTWWDEGAGYELILTDAGREAIR
jgi:hypothetical protein